MNWFKNLKIKFKLILSFTLVSLIGTMIGLIGLISLTRVERISTEIASNRLVSIDALWMVSEGQTAMKSNIRTLLIPTLTPERAKEIIEKNIPRDLEKIKKGLDVYTSLSQTKEEEILWNEFLPLWKIWEENTIKEVSLLKEYWNGNKSDKLHKESFNLVEINRDAFSHAETALNNILLENQKISENLQEELRKTNDNASYSLIITIIIGFIISLSLGVIIAALISKPIIKITHLSEAIAEGNVEVSVDFESKDELGLMAKSFEKMLLAIKKQVALIEKIAAGDMRVVASIRSDKDVMNQKLNYMININNRVFGEINRASEQVTIAAEQVAQAATSTAQAATEQSSTIEEITATVADISSQARENASNAREVNLEAIKAKENALKGSNQMETMLGAMNEINEASSKIAKIIKVIDDIAFQTNILALNAAVEAARAGAHGKGFAVVAEEVRNLAARSAQAANETTDLIESTIKKIKDGNTMAKDTTEGLKEILGIVDKVSTMINEITEASGDQATAIAQISQAITQISDVVQTNSATSEESAAASEELAGQAGLLKQAVSRFKLKNEDARVEDEIRIDTKEHNFDEDNLEFNSEDELDLGKYKY